jgi:predicted enzyme related to lactoylglutathione lyase
MNRMDHTIVHFEIPAADVDKLKQFYAGLFGWKIEKCPGPMDYWMIQTVPVDENGMPQRPRVNSGMVKKNRPEQKIVNCISVELIDESIEKVKKLGGKIISPKQKVPNVGWIATAVDPEGDHIALLQPQRM